MGTKPFSMKMQSETKRKLELLAEENHRSMSAEIHYLIDVAWEARNPTPIRVCGEDVGTESERHVEEA